MAATKLPGRGRRGRYTRARRDDRPKACPNCRRPTIWGVVLEADGKLRLNVKGNLAHIQLNAEPNPIGAYEYVRGSLSRPVVRHLDLEERMRPSDTTRYSQHRDTPAVEW